MNDSPEKSSKGFRVIDIGLDPCPFCRKDPEFGLDFKTGHFELRHYPDSGVICPAVILAYCEDAAFARRLWNWRPVHDHDLEGKLRRIREVARDIAASPEKARAFLVNAGIATDDGQLTAPYREES